MLSLFGFDLSQPFALIAKGQDVTLFTGGFHFLDALASIHALSKSQNADIVFALPYRVIRERGFEANGDEPILALAVTASHTQRIAELLPLLPERPIALEAEIAPSLSDAAYEAVVGRFQETEIAGGNVSQTTLSRRFSGRVQDFNLETLLSIYGRLLRDDGQYMTVLFVMPDEHAGRRLLLGAKPVRHLQITGNETLMNPIAGTLRKEDRDTFPQRLQRFVQDPKEINELFQVLDEEMKMMSLICPGGGRIEGPFLREIGAVVHSEYELAGKRGTDSIDALRRTLHAPTVMGSPMESAARVIARYEPDSRRYYAGEIGIYHQPRGPEPNGDLDAAILIRCAEFTQDGTFHVQAGGGLVRDSVPADEARESRAKAMGFLATLTGTGAHPAKYLTDELRASIQPVFAARNARLAPFWMQAQPPLPVVDATIAGLRLTVVNNEDDFAHMLAHLLGHLGASVVVVDTMDYHAETHGCDILVIGPGPGDPTDMAYPRMNCLQDILATAQSAGTPVLGVCLGHQALAVAQGLTVTRQPESSQGMQRPVAVFGTPHRLGFYNSFSPVMDAAATRRVDIVCDVDEGRIQAMQGPGFIGFQFHPESVMSETGLDLLRRALHSLAEGGLAEK